MENNYWFLNIIVLIIFFLIFYIYRKVENRKIKKITKYIQEINKKNYDLKLCENREGEISILKNEIYKTTVMLKEVAENSVKDKINLKDALSDISHQLKTPFTSILIILDNLIDDSNMPEEIRAEFIRDIKQEIININFLINSILILSKFDSNTVEFNREEVKIKDLINDSIKRNSILADLRNVKIESIGDENIYLKCDRKWQTEAIMNILKDCIEHSFEENKIIIKYEKNNVYTQISIRDFGDGIDKEDIPHIFERFYRGKNASANGVGIGLALSKSIIEKENGSVFVTSDENGTEFVIKYF